MTRVINELRMIRPTPGDRLLRPVEVIRDCRLNQVGGSPLNFPVPFAGTSGKNMILTIIQLLWITLETRLVGLILIALVVLIIASSVASPLKPSIMTLVPLEPRACEGSL